MATNSGPQIGVMNPPQPNAFSYGGPQNGKFSTSPMQMPTTYQSPYAGMAFNPSSAPITPAYNSTFNPQTESLAPQIGQMLNETPYDTQPLDQLKSNAESTAPSSWANLMNQTARTNTQQAGSQAAASTAGSTAQAEGNLAMSGGLSSGARERLQQSGEQAGIGAQQDVAREGATNLANIGMQDAQVKQQELQALPGMETQAYQAKLQPISMYGQAAAQDVANEGNSIAGLNAFNIGAYGSDASMYGASKTADATAAAAADQEAHSGLLGQGGPLGTGIGTSGGPFGTNNSSLGKYLPENWGQNNNGSTVFCTELHRQGEMSDTRLRKAKVYGAIWYQQNREMFEGYQKFASRVVPFMQKYSWLNKILVPPLKCWAREITGEPNFVGGLVLGFLKVISKVTGVLTRRSKCRRLA